ncbi:MAG: LysR family transcriptional regulator [Thalassovita sp.]
MKSQTEPTWDDLRTILAVVRAGTLAGAGQMLGVNYTTIARRIARAEAMMDQILFEKLADGYRPTEAAVLIAEHAEKMEQNADQLLRRLSGKDQRLTGPLVVAAPQLLIAHCLAPVLQQFSQAHPGIQLRIRASNDKLDLGRREADIAIRISKNPGDTLMGLRLATQHSAGFASAEYAQKIIDNPTAPIDWLIYEGNGKLPAYVQQNSPRSRVHVLFDDMVPMAWAAQQGLGVTKMPLFLGRALDLVQVPILPPQPYIDIWMVAHSDVWASAKVRAFREVVTPFFRKNRATFVAPADQVLD